MPDIEVRIHLASVTIMSSITADHTVNPDCHLWASWREAPSDHTYKLNVLTGTRDANNGSVGPFDDIHALSLLHSCGLAISRHGLPKNTDELTILNDALHRVREDWFERYTLTEQYTHRKRLPTLDPGDPRADRPSERGVIPNSEDYLRIHIRTGQTSHVFFGAIKKGADSNGRGEQLLVSTGPGISYGDFPIHNNEKQNEVSLCVISSVRMCGAHAPCRRKPRPALQGRLDEAYRKVVEDHFPQPRTIERELRSRSYRVAEPSTHRHSKTSDTGKLQSFAQTIEARTLSRRPRLGWCLCHGRHCEGVHD